MCTYPYNVAGADISTGIKTDVGGGLLTGASTNIETDTDDGISMGIVPDSEHVGSRNSTEIKFETDNGFA